MPPCAVVGESVFVFDRVGHSEGCVASASQTHSIQLPTASSRPCESAHRKSS